MNERIKLLAEQAAIMTSAEVTWHKDRISWQKLYDQKFAELLVQECLAVARQRLFRNYEGDSHRVAHNNAIWCSLTDIEEHFGVDE
jgi:metal-dependent amidase/aminoacylase/carboxypeptidase family protein